jgi:HSP20 family protein
MMNLAMWDPFVSSGSLGNVFGPDTFKDRGGQWRPVADLASDDSGYTIRFDVPGVSKDDIDINVEDRVLTISGERSDTFDSDEKSNVYRREAFYGKFSRAFRLPEDADTENVTASYVNGVLEVRVPKSAEAQSRRIEIGTA